MHIQTYKEIKTDRYKLRQKDAYINRQTEINTYRQRDKDRQTNKEIKTDRQTKR